MNLSPQQIFDGKYKILSPLGSGGMGSVYLAEQIGLGRQVALKVLNPAGSLQLHEEFAIRFQREALVLSKLSHKHIGLFYQYGTCDDFTRTYPYIVMEYLEGKSLQQLLNQESPMDWKRAVAILIQVCEAMDYSHRSGVVHRDLTPNNIFLLNEPKMDNVKVLDFGLSKVFFEESALQHLTKTGELIGSVNYMSPEQCRGEKATSSSDIYSLGCVLYQCCTGKVPHQADSPIGVIHKHATETPDSPHVVNPSLPQALSAIIMKAMSIPIQERYASMNDFQQDLLLILNGADLPIQALAKKSRKGIAKDNDKRKGAVILALTVFCLLSILVFVGLQLPRFSQRRNEKTLDLDHSPRTSWSVRPITEAESLLLKQAEQSPLIGDIVEVNRPMKECLNKAYESRSLNFYLKVWQCLINRWSDPDAPAEYLKFVKSRSFRTSGLSREEKKKSVCFAYYSCALSAKMLGNYKAALEIINEASKDPFCTIGTFERERYAMELSFLKGICLRRSGKFKEAILWDKRMYDELSSRDLLSLSFGIASLCAMISDKLFIDGAVDPNLLEEYKRNRKIAFENREYFVQETILELIQNLVDLGKARDAEELVLLDLQFLSANEDSEYRLTQLRALVGQYCISATKAGSKNDTIRFAKSLKSSIQDASKKKQEICVTTLSSVNLIKWWLLIFDAKDEAEELSQLAEISFKKAGLQYPSFAEFQQLPALLAIRKSKQGLLGAVPVRLLFEDYLDLLKRSCRTLTVPSAEFMLQLDCGIRIALMHPEQAGRSALMRDLRRLLASEGVWKKLPDDSQIMLLVSAGGSEHPTEDHEFEEIKSIVNRSSSPLAKSMGLRRMAQCYSESGNNGKAIELAKGALSIGYSDIETINNQGSLGYFHFRQGDRNSAKAFQWAAIEEMAKKDDPVPELRHRTCEQLIEIYSKEQPAVSASLRKAGDDLAKILEIKKKLKQTSKQ